MEGEQVRKTKTAAKIAGLLTLGCLFAGLVAMPVFGASRKRISSVNIEVEAEIQPETRIGEETIDVSVKGGKYYYDYYDVENDGFEWEENDIPKISIYLRAEAGYYFSLTKASSVKLSGATYVKATKEDSSETLKLTVKLPSLAETVGDQSDVMLTNNGYAIWKEVRGAGSYEVRLYRNGEGVGATMLTTTDSHYNFQSAMTKPGDYQVKVRPVNKVNQDNKGTWKESTVITLSSEDATRIRNGEGGIIVVCSSEELNILRNQKLAILELERIIGNHIGNQINLPIIRITHFHDGEEFSEVVLNTSQVPFIKDNNIEILTIGCGV